MLDRMQKAVWVNAVVNGDLDAIKTVLRIMDRRARLFGLDAPVKLRVDETMTDEQFAEKMAELIGAMEPDALGELLRELPGTAGRSLLNADGPAAHTGMNGHPRRSRDRQRRAGGREHPAATSGRMVEHRVGGDETHCRTDKPDL